jgi:hypothetical protein
MPNLWPGSFDAFDAISPSSLLKEQAEHLPALTNGIVFAELTEVEGFEAVSMLMMSPFNFRFDIRGRFLESYRFRLLTISHDITLYPVKVTMDEGVAKEIGMRPGIGGFVAEAQNAEAFAQLLEAALKSKRVNHVIGSIIRLTR